MSDKLCSAQVSPSAGKGPGDLLELGTLCTSVVLLQPLAFPALWGVLVIPHSYSQIHGWFLDGSPSRGSKGPSQSPWKCPVTFEDLDLCVKVLHGGAEPRPAAPSSLPAPGSGRWRKPFPKFFQIKSSCGLGHKHCQGKSGVALLAEMLSFSRKKGLGCL